MNIRKMPTIPTLPKKKKVAAYARVSSGKDTMLHSLSAQISYYSEYIQKQPEWLYCGVYVDEAVTGTKSERPEFQRLLSDCRAGKIDMIVTKSISRFARNTAVRVFKKPDTFVLRSGKRTARMPKEFAFEKRVGNGAAVHDHELVVHAGDGSGHKVLADSGFPLDKHRACV